MPQMRAIAVTGRGLLAAVALFTFALRPAAADFGAGLEAYDAGDFETVLAEWRPLAEAGDLEAQVALAGLYLEGAGVAADPAAAARWYRRAAERGDAVAQLNLGELYSRGLGVERNLVEAYLWLSLAAAQGRDWPGTRRREIARLMSRAEVAEAERRVEAWRPGE
ncbi:MAG: hypothetical protein OEM59_01570 [Rhodospirillales bacterium]|nr:hypothetical protein [Rhodospirillales bacterium]